MVYIMEFYVDGACRRNGYHGAIGAAAAATKDKFGNWDENWTFELPSQPPPTNQRAEISAVILALRSVLSSYKQLYSAPYLKVRVHSDSKYAVNCMTQWVHKWCQNGWVNSEGYEVASRDLIQRALDLEDALQEIGEVEYVWVPRGENEYADQLCNEVLDGMS